MVVIAGLGNPGNKYESTRHNIGFMVVDELARRYGLGSSKSRFKAHTFSGRVQGVSSLLLKPQTFMNLSGESVGPALGFYKLSPESLIVVHDEVDVPYGQVRAKNGGGLAGHNGLKSIAKVVGSREFSRVRVGVGRPPGRQPVADWVLSAFSKEEATELVFSIDRAADIVEAIVRDGVEDAMNRFNGK